MKVVVHPGLTMDTMTPVELAVEVASRGLHGIYLPEHTHIPVDFDPAEYPTPGQDLPDRYRRLLDPYIALAVIAGAEPGYRDYARLSYRIFRRVPGRRCRCQSQCEPRVPQ